MKKLIFTLALVALSGSSLFGIHRSGAIIPKPIITNGSQPSGTTAKRIMNQDLSDCMNRKGTSSMDMTDPKAQQAYDECYQEIYGQDGEASIGGKDGLYY